MGEESRQGPDRRLVQPLALAEEPVLERGLLDSEPVQEVAAVERDRLSERRGSACGDQPLELDDVHRYSVGLERHHVAIGIQRIVLPATEVSSQ